MNDLLKRAAKLLGLKPPPPSVTQITPDQALPDIFIPSRVPGGTADVGDFTTGKEAAMPKVYVLMIVTQAEGLVPTISVFADLRDALDAATMELHFIAGDDEKQHAIAVAANDRLRETSLATVRWSTVDDNMCDQEYCIFCKEVE